MSGRTRSRGRHERLGEPSEWLALHWEDAPTRLHDHATEPDSQLGAPVLTARWRRRLYSLPFEKVWAEGGVQFRQPMLAALEALRRSEPERYALVRALAANGFNVHQTARSRAVSEAEVLRAVRALQKRYSSTPLPRRRKSEAQLDAESAPVYSAQPIPGEAGVERPPALVALTEASNGNPA